MNWDYGLINPGAERCEAGHGQPTDATTMGGEIAPKVRQGREGPPSPFQGHNQNVASSPQRLAGPHTRG